MSANMVRNLRFGTACPTPGASSARADAVAAIDAERRVWYNSCVLGAKALGTSIFDTRGMKLIPSHRKILELGNGHAGCVCELKQGDTL